MATCSYKRDGQRVAKCENRIHFGCLTVEGLDVYTLYVWFVMLEHLLVWLTSSSLARYKQLIVWRAGQMHLNEFTLVLLQAYDALFFSIRVVCYHSLLSFKGHVVKWGKREFVISEYKFISSNPLCIWELLIYLDNIAISSQIACADCTGAKRWSMTWPAMILGEGALLPLFQQIRWL